MWSSPVRTRRRSPRCRPAPMKARSARTGVIPMMTCNCDRMSSVAGSAALASRGRRRTNRPRRMMTPSWRNCRVRGDGWMSRSDAQSARASLDWSDGQLQYLPQWVDARMAEQWLRELLVRTPWTQPQLTLYGRTVAVPRQVAWYGDADARYRYRSEERRVGKECRGGWPPDP